MHLFFLNLLNFVLIFSLITHKFDGYRVADWEQKVANLCFTAVEEAWLALEH
jgi:hypothetical protein